MEVQRRETSRRIFGSVAMDVFGIGLVLVVACFKLASQKIPVDYWLELRRIERVNAVWQWRDLSRYIGVIKEGARIPRFARSIDHPVWGRQ